MSKHLCIKKEDGLYINGAKCTDGFIEGGEYEDGKDFKVEYLYSEYSGDTLMPNDDGDYAILLPALKEDSGLTLWIEVIKDVERAQFIEEKYITTIDRLSNNYTITKKQK